jgi:O-antigen/teichoic acid export membrane protein
MSVITDILKTKPSDLFKNPIIRKNIINSFYYFGGTLVQFLIAIFTQPIFSKYLELEDFAIIGYYSAITAILYPLFSMTLPFYYMAQYWQKKDGSENLSFILNFLNISNAVLAFVSFIIVTLYFKVFNIAFPLMPFIIIVIANLFFEKYKTFYLLECRVQKKGLRFFLINILQIVINTCFSLFFVVFLKEGAAGRMIGPLTAVILISVIAIVVFVKEKKYKFSFTIDKEKIKPALKFCLPLVIAAYAYYPIDNIDRLYLERLNNPIEYGYYTIGLTIAGFIGTFFSALYQSFEPDLYKLIAQQRYKQYLLFSGFYISVIAIFSFAFIVLSSSIVAFLTAGKYVYASDYANVFILSIFFMQLGGLFEQLFNAFGATKLVLWRNIFMGVLCVVLHYLMIKKYQFHGANITRVITSIFYVISGAVMFFIYFKRRKRILHEE